MAIDFPNSPTNGQIYTSGDKSWIWDGTVWKAYGASLSPTVLKVDSTNTRVGINNQSPAYTLDVNGTVEATQFIQGTDYLTPYTGFRNAIINGDFRINQRAWSSSTTDATYGFDRWKFFRNGGTVTNSAQSFAPNSPAATGYESPSYLRTVVSGHSASSDYAHIGQNIEDVRTFANSQITISFWARCVPAGGESSTPSISVELQTNYGSPGGSSGVLTYFGKTAITTSWARYSITGTVPSLSGKTIGTTANTSSLMIALWYSAGANFNSRTGSLGVQNNTFDIWGVQVERGSVATPFEQRPIQTELALCQRYYEKSYALATAPGTNTATGMMLFYGTTAGSNTAQLVVRFLVPKRYTSYTVTGYNGFGNSGVWEYYRSGASNSSATLTVDLQTEQSFRGYIETGAAYAPVQINAHWVCNAEF